MPWIDIERVIKENPPSAREIRQVIDYRSRKAKPRFYAYENFPAAVIDVLREKDAKVATAQEMGLCGRSDEDHVAFALKKGWVLLTCDRDYLNEARFPLVHCPAIFVFDFGSGSAEEVELALQCLAPVFQSPQFFDKWWKVDASPSGWTESVRHQNGSSSRTRCRVFDDRLQEWVDDA